MSLEEHCKITIVGGFTISPQTIYLPIKDEVYDLFPTFQRSITDRICPVGLEIGSDELSALIEDLPVSSGKLASHQQLYLDLAWRPRPGVYKNYPNDKALPFFGFVSLEVVAFPRDGDRLAFSVMLHPTPAALISKSVDFTQDDCNLCNSYPISLNNLRSLFPFFMNNFANWNNNYEYFIGSVQI